MSVDALLYFWFISTVALIVIPPLVHPVMKFIEHMKTPKYIQEGMVVDQKTGQVRSCGGYYVSRITGKKVRRY